MSDSIVVRVGGLPTPQGSKSGFVHPHTGRVVLVEGKGAGRARHKAWRSAVHDAATRWAAEHELPAPLDEPVRVSMVFWLPRPQSWPRWRWLPSSKPDLDKLCRSTLDSLSGVLIVDDCRVVELSARKLCAIDRPLGALVQVTPLGRIELERGNAWAVTGHPPRL